MVWPTSLLYRQALARPHQVVFHVTSTDINGAVLTRNAMGQPTLMDIPYSGGSVSAKMVNRVTRTLNFSVTETWYPTTAVDPLAPESAVLHVTGGLQYGNGTTELFPLFTGRVWDVDLSNEGVATIQCQDLAADVIGYPFEQLWSVRNPGSCLAEIQAIILDALPQATFTVGDAFDAPVPASLTFDEDRGKALDDLAAALGARWYTLGDGSFTVARMPYTLGSPVADITDTGNLLATSRLHRTRDGVANSVTVISERTDGTAPVQSTSRDTQASSPTRFGGLFGKAAQIIKVQTPLTQGQAKTLSDASLLASVALTEQWDITCVPDYSLEPSDTVRMQSRGRSSVQVIDSITYPLATGGAQSVGGRALVSANISLAG